MARQNYMFCNQSIACVVISGEIAGAYRREEKKCGQCGEDPEVAVTGSDRIERS